MNKSALYEPLNNYFNHIYVITLKRAVERHEEIKENLDGLHYEFFYGADNKEFSMEQLIQQNIYSPEKAKALHRYNNPMKAGVVGCSLSHKMVYQDILANKYQRVLILEDDILPAENGLMQFAEIVQQLPPSWELLYFDYNKNTTYNLPAFLKQKFYHLQKFFGALKWSHTTIHNLYAKKYSGNLKIAGFHDFTSAYCITKSAAEKLIPLQTPVALASDNLLAHAITNNIIKGFISIPKLFVQQSQANKQIIGSYAEENN